MISKWIIQDWMSNRVFPDKDFGSFESARDFITQHADATAKDENEHDGICEDLSAIEVMEPLDTRTIETVDEVRSYVEDWQRWFSEQLPRWNDIEDWVNAFDKLADRFPELADELLDYETWAKSRPRADVG